DTVVQPAEQESGTTPRPAASAGEKFDDSIRPHSLQLLAAANMRMGPSSGQPVIKVIPAGSTVQVLKGGSWCEVGAAGHRGWVYKALMTATGVEADSDR